MREKRGAGLVIFWVNKHAWLCISRKQAGSYCHGLLAMSDFVS